MKKKRKGQSKNNALIISAIVIVLAGIIIALTLLLGNKPATEKKKTSDAKQEEQIKKEEKEINAEEKSWDVWTTDTINMRAKPKKDSDVVMVVSRNTKLTASGEEDGWLKVTLDDKQGYISKEYTTTEEPTTNGMVICIDPGHQSSGDSNVEPNGPGSATTKARVTGGTRGTTTGVYEYELNLAIALMLRDELESRGYTVYMTRESHDVNISNMERAQYATSVGADITVRIHANGADNAGVSGAMALAPSSSNPYISNLAADSQYLSQCVLDAYCAATGMGNQGVSANDTMTGINWCTMPVTILEMGYMTNPTDDTNMQDASFRQKMVSGIANGIDKYFGL